MKKDTAVTGIRRFKARLVKEAALGVIICLAGCGTALRAEDLLILHTNDTHGVYLPYKIRLENGWRMVGGMVPWCRDHSE